MAYQVVVGAGSLRSPGQSAQTFPHGWTPDGVSVEAEFTGGHLFNLAAAGCVLNDVYREAAALGVDVRGVRVSAEGDFEPGTWRSTGITYFCNVDSDAGEDGVEELLRRVDAVAEIPKAMRQGATVVRRAS